MPLDTQQDLRSDPETKFYRRKTIAGSRSYHSKTL